MDLTFIVMLDAPTHPLTGRKNARRPKNGDLVGVFESIPVGERDVLNLNTRLGHIHVTGMPEKPLDIVKRKMIGPIVQTVIGGGQGGEDVDEAVRRYGWNTKLSRMPQGMQNQMRTDHQITINWTQMKNLCRRRSVVNQTDPDSDVETLTPTDGMFDIPVVSDGV